MSAVHYRYHLSNALPHRRPIFEVHIARFAARFREAVLKPDCSVIHSGDPLRCVCLSIEFACLCVLAITCCDRFDGRVASQFLPSFSAIRTVRLASELLVCCAIVSFDLNAIAMVGNTLHAMPFPNRFCVFGWRLSGETSR